MSTSRFSTFWVRISLVLLSLLPIALWGQKSGQECFPKKQTDRMCYDVAGALSPDESLSIENRLRDFVKSTSNEIAVVIVPDLCGMERAQFAIELGELWQVGQQKEDNGIIVLVKPRNNESKGQVFIAIGRGLEGVIPDATAHLIVENEMLPSFRNNRMYEGIDNALTVLMELSIGAYNSNAYADKYNKSHQDEIYGGLVVLFIFLIVAFIFGIKIIQTRRYARLNHMEFWAAWALLNSVTTSHNDSWRHFTGGGGGGGGFTSGGGGFGGFGGGGSFGGGGAGGSW